MKPSRNWFNTQAVPRCWNKGIRCYNIFHWSWHKEQKEYHSENTDLKRTVWSWVFWVLKDWSVSVPWETTEAQNNDEPAQLSSFASIRLNHMTKFNLKQLRLKTFSQLKCVMQAFQLEISDITFCKQFYAIGIKASMWLETLLLTFSFTMKWLTICFHFCILDIPAENINEENILSYYISSKMCLEFFADKISICYCIC